jgi:SAM-dependent methyltransferase
MLLGRLVPSSAAAARSVEVGSGDSLLAAELAGRGLSLEGLLLTDESAEMLDHSRPFAGRGARLAVAQAHELPVADGSVELLVAALADPYDDERFWAEVARVLAPSGLGVVTTPSWEWAARFRRDTGAPHTAVFELSTGELVAVPSHVRSPEDEAALIERSGLRVVERSAVTLADLPAPRAPKLEVLREADPVVTGYVVARAGS